VHKKFEPTEGKNIVLFAQNEVVTKLSEIWVGLGIRSEKKPISDPKAATLRRFLSNLTAANTGSEQPAYSLISFSTVDL
jgi:hypothetical protein